MSSFNYIRSGLLKKYNVRPSDEEDRKESNTGTTVSTPDTTSDFYSIRENLLGKYSQEKTYQRRQTVSDWASRYNKVMENLSSGFGDSGQWKTSQDMDNMEVEIGSLLRDYEEIREYADRTGLPNAFRYANELKKLQEDMPQYRDYFGQWDSQEGYDGYLAEQAETQKKKTLDLDAYQTELDDLDDQILQVKNKITAASLDVNSMVGSGLPAETSAAKRLSDLRLQLSDLEKARNQKRTYLNDARRLQEWEALSGVSNPQSPNYDPEFQKYAGYSSTKADNLWDRVWSQYSMGYGDLTYEYINGAENGMRDQILQKARAFNAGSPSDDGETIFEKNSYDQMTEDEIGIYNYYYAKDGKEKAEQYLDSIQESLNYRKATAGFSNLEGKTGLEMIFGVAAGLDQFESGVKNLVNTKDQYIPHSSTQFLSGMVREDLEDTGPAMPQWLGDVSLGQMAYDTITTSANMVPSILTSMAVSIVNPAAGSVAGAGLLGASAAGNAYQEALNQGYDQSQARAYSALIGASEAGLQYLLGGISKLGGKITGPAVTKMLNGIDNGILRTAAKIGGNMFSEGFEEGLQEVLTPWFESLTLGIDEDVNWSDAAYSFLLGAFTAGVMEGPNTVVGEVNTYNTGRQLQKAGVTANRLAEIGSTMSADSVAYRLAGKVDANTGAYTMGRMFQEIGAEITAQNQSDIQNALVSRGVAQRDAAILANGFANVVAGAELTEAQSAAIEANDVLSQVVQDVIINPNSTVYQRSQGYNEILKSLANERAGVSASRESAPASDSDIRSEEGNIPSENSSDQRAAVGFESESAEFSDKGRTILSSTGEEVTIQEIVANGNGNQKLRLEDGRVVDSSDVSFGSEGEALVYEAISNMGVNPSAANILVKNYDPGQGITANEYVQQIQNAYRFGQLSIPEADLISSPLTDRLNDRQRNQAYRLGKMFGGKQAAKEQAIARKGRSKSTESKGRVQFDGNRSNLTDIQKTSISALETVADTLGVQIYLFESSVDENGQRTGANGWYDPKDGSIHIDLYAGMNGEGTMLFTAAHELTHYIKQWSPAKFKILANFLMKEYGQRGVSVDQLVTAQMEKAERSGRELSYEEAYEELIADSMESMLSDGDVIQKLAKLKEQDKSLWQKIMDFINDLAAKIKKAYAGLSPDSAEGRYVAQMKDAIEKLQDLFVEGLADASSNYQTKTSGIEVTIDGEKLKYQQRSFQEQIDEVIDGKFPSDSAVYVGKTPSILAEIGFDGNLPMLVTQKHIKDAIAPKNDQIHQHGLTVDQVKSIPDKLKSPVMLIDSFKSGSNTVLAVIDEVDPDGCPVVVSIKADGSGRFNGILVDSNFITSMYGRERFSKFLERCIKENKLLYVDQKKSQSLSISSSVQFAEQLKGISSNVIIRKSDVIVNEKSNPARDFYGRNLDKTNRADKTKFSMRNTSDTNSNLRSRGTMSANESESRITYLRERISEVEDSLDFAEGADATKLSRELAKLNYELSDLIANERRAAKKTPLNVILDSLGDYRRSDLESLAEQLSDGAWDGYEDLDRTDLEEGIREMIQDLGYSPIEMQNVKYGLYVRPVESAVKFSMRSEVEVTKNLVAIHNLTEEKLLKALDLGGFPMPSIAVTKSDIPHTNFGEISLVMKKETVDPKANRKNTVYSADAWTPVFPVIEYDINEKSVSSVSHRLRDLSEKVDGEFRDSVIKAISSFREYVTDGGSRHAVSMLRDNYGLKAAYLEENGTHIGKIEKQVENDLGFQEGRIDKYRAITEVLGVNDPDSIRKIPLKEIRENYGAALEKVFPGMTRTAIRMGSILRQTAAWLENPRTDRSYRTVADIEAMQKMVDDSIDQRSYELWLNDLLSGVEGEKGARNGKSTFTSSGNARTFKQTHVPVTLENITKVMASENGGKSKNVSSFVGVKSLRAGMAERFTSIADIHKAEGRLQNLSEEEEKSVTDNLGDRMYNLMERIYGLKEHSRHENKYITMDSIGEILMEIADLKQITGDSIAEKFLEYGYNLDGSLAFEVRDLLFDISQMPVNIFEAKPERAVRFDEVLAAIVPTGISDGLKNSLSENGVQVLEYRRDDVADRLEKVNSVEGAKFQQRERRTETVVQLLKDQNAKLQEDLQEAKKLVKLQGQVTGGRVLKQSSIESAAKYLKNQWSIGGDTNEFSSLLKSFYDHILNGEEISWETVRENAQPVVDFMIQNEKTHLDSYAESVLSSLKGRKIRLNKSQREEVVSAFGSIRDFQRAIAGTVKLAKDGIPLDVLFAEMNAEFPGEFSDNLSDADMPAALADVVSTMRSMDVSNTFGMDPQLVEQDMVRDVYDSYWRVSTLYTTADKYSRQILNLKSAHDERIQKIRKDQRERVKKLQEEQKQALEQTREKYRKRLDDQYEKLTTKYRESRKNAIDSRNRTAMRHKVQKVVKELNDYLLKGTKERHVPIELQKAVAEALDAVNMDTVGAAERIAKLEADLARAKTPEQMQEITHRIDNVRAAGENMSAKLTALKDAYAKFVDSDDPMIANSYDSVISDKIESVIDSVGNTALRDMTIRQLEDVYDMYRMVLTTVRNANKAFRAAKGETITQLSSEVMSQLSSQKSQPELQTKVAEGISRFRWNNLKPVYAFERIGSSTFTSLFNRVRSGEDTWAVDVTEARDFFREQAKKYNFDSWDFDSTHTFESASGAEFSLSLQQIMSLYALSKREQALDHLRRGGIVIDSSTEVTKKTALGIKRKFNPTKATSYNIKDETLADIVSTLTADQKAFADAMQGYLSTTMGAKGNEVSLELYGIKLFKEKNYFPLRSATQFMAKAKEQQMIDPKIKNKGFTKETVRKASNPIVLTPFMNVWAGHVNEMSMYHAFTLPMEDFYRVYNFKTPTSEKTATKSVEMLLQNAHGKAATAYIDQLLRDLNGGVRADASAGIINKGIGMFKKGAVFASLSVVVQQPSAIARAAALIDTKYFIGPKVDPKRHAALWAEVKKYAPIAIIKEMGYFDTNMGLSTYDFITGKEYSGFSAKMKAAVSDSNYRDEILSKAPALADELAWCGIWEAVKRETADKNRSMDTQSDAFLKKCAERFTDVIIKTQVYDSVLARSALMRSKDTGVKMATSFLAEPTTSINMVEDALIKGKNGDKTFARRAIGSVIASQILNGILVSFVYAGRDDDEEKTYLEKYLGSLSGSVVDSLNPGNYIPFIRDIISIVQGYEVERSDMSVISDLWNAWKKLGSSTVAPYRKVEDFVGSIAQIFGLPVKNIMRDARGIYNTINSFLGGKNTTWTGTRYAIQENLPGILGGGAVSRQNRLYTAIVNGDKEYVDRLKGSYADDASYGSAIRAALRANDSRIRDAAVARQNGDLDEYTRIAYEIIGEGNFDQDTVVMAINAEINAMSTDTTTSSSAPKSQSLYDTDDFATAIIQGDQAMANAIRKEIIRVSELNGKTEEDAADSFSRSAKSVLKDQFVSGNIGSSQVVNALVTYCGESKEDAEADVQYWDFTVRYPDVYADDSWFDAYNKNIADYGIPIDTYMEYRDIVRDITGEGKKERRMAIIDSLPISDYQKDAMYYAEGWAESTINEAPWR